MEAILAALCGLLGIIVTKFFDYKLAQKKEQSENNKELVEIKSSMSNIQRQLALQEKDNLRTQILLMITDFPDEITDILRLGQHYFNDLNGNWVLTAAFRDWASKKKIDLPNWFPKEN